MLGVDVTSPSMPRDALEAVDHLLPRSLRGMSAAERRDRITAESRKTGEVLRSARDRISSGLDGFWPERDSGPEM